MAEFAVSRARSVNGIVEGFERFLASRGLAPIPDPPSPPAIVFVDLTGFTQLTQRARRYVRGGCGVLSPASRPTRQPPATAGVS